MNSNIPQTSRSRWKAVLLLALVFLLGAGCGIGGGLLVMRRVFQHAIAHPDGKHAPVDLIVGRIESKILSDIDLTEDERTAVQAELTQTAADLKALRVEIWGKVSLNVQATLDRLAKRLPPEKVTRLRSETEKYLKPWGLMSD